MTYNITRKDIEHAEMRLHACQEKGFEKFSKEIWTRTKRMKNPVKLIAWYMVLEKAGYSASMKNVIDRMNQLNIYWKPYISEEVYEEVHPFHRELEPEPIPVKHEDTFMDLLRDL